MSLLLPLDKTGMEVYTRSVMKPKKYQPVYLSIEMYERVRRHAYETHTSLKKIVERALKNHYGWNIDKKKTKGGENVSPTENQGPPP